MDELEAKHRKEAREMQNKITQKKKNATKKTRKGVNDECDVLQRDLLERQKAEIDALGFVNIEDGAEKLSLSEEKLAEESAPKPDGLPAKSVEFDGSAKDDDDASNTASGPRAKKPSRQKARLARRAAEQESQAAAAAEEAANLPDLRVQELTAMKVQMEKRGLVETSVRPDGHCLYSAVAHGLGSEKVKGHEAASEPYQNVRYTAAEFISTHPDDFSAFLEESVESYVKKVKDTAEWGGQLELQALARAYNVSIHVLQADGRVEIIKSDGATSTEAVVWLAYYRHSFGLGEHYNALTKSGKA